MKYVKRILYPLAFIVFLLALWQIICELGLVNSALLPSPRQVWLALAEVAHSGLLIGHIVASLTRVLSGFILAVAVAIPLGLFIGNCKLAQSIVNPTVQIVRTISPIAWIPLAILWFGIGNAPAIFIIFVTAFFPLLLSTILAVKNVDPIFVKVGKNFGATRTKLLFKVIFPAVLPYIVIALRVSLGIAWVIIVAAEMVGMSSGLGYMILDARNFLRTDIVIAGMAVIGVIGFVLDKVLSLVEEYVKGRWNIIEWLV